MKLSQWAKLQGVSYKTAWRWFDEGKLPVPVEQMATGTLLVKTSGYKKNKDCVVYVRVSSGDQKSDIDRQIARVVAIVTQQGFTVSKTVTEIGAGLNGHKPKFMRLLSDSSIKIIAVEYKDRLMRLGYEYVKYALKSQGRSLIVVDNKELEDDLVEEGKAVLTSFCARLYGRRSAKNKAKKTLEALKNDSNTCP
ncbi:MAG TPA: IS607 family transposase [Thioploca sp.]|nr:MAG: IS607 family transposase [Gammaproteobacteria bacterium]HDN25666.1 IS607 family transposase [Thioploca sp.]